MQTTHHTIPHERELDTTAERVRRPDHATHASKTLGVSAPRRVFMHASAAAHMEETNDMSCSPRHTGKPRLLVQQPRFQGSVRPHCVIAVNETRRAACRRRSSTRPTVAHAHAELVFGESSPPPSTDAPRLRPMRLVAHAEEQLGAAMDGVLLGVIRVLLRRDFQDRRRLGLESVHGVADLRRDILVDQHDRHV